MKNKRNGVVKYWVKWEGYGDNQFTLKPEESLLPKAVKYYWRLLAWTGNQQEKCRKRRNKLCIWVDMSLGYCRV